MTIGDIKLGQKTKCRKGRSNFTQISKNGTFIKTAIIADETRKFRLKREQWALSIARSRCVNVPVVIDYYINSEQNEVLVLECLKAKELTSYPNKFKIEAMRLVGSQMSKLGFMSKEFGWPHPDTMKGEFDNWGSFLYSFTRIYGERIVSQKIISEHKLTFLLSMIKEFDFHVENSSLVHRDIKPNNILCTSDSRIWIVDWENTLLGDKLFDIATYGANYGQDTLWEAFAEGLGLSTDSQTYRLYEIITLIGTIDFYWKQGLEYQKPKQQLDLLIEKL